jgi:hypothetical protein
MIKGNKPFFLQEYEKILKKAIPTGKLHVSFGVGDHYNFLNEETGAMEPMAGVINSFFIIINK